MARIEHARTLTAGLALLLAAGCLNVRPENDDTPPPPSPANFPALPSGPNLRVLVLGDHGTGEEGQQGVADAIARTHAAEPPELALTVGDNFYPEGVTSPEDPLWESIFERVYAGPFWDDVVFYPSLGNHDHYGDPGAQIRYSLTHDRWQMPGAYYAFRRGIPEGDSILFLALDTTPLHGGTGSGQAQLQWVDSVLSASRDQTRAKDTWILAYGHHPMTTVGWHPGSGEVRADLLPRFRTEVPLYLAGHNHSTELMPVDRSTLQAVCGGGAGLDNPYRVDPTSETLSAFTNGGWCFLRIWPEALVVELYDRTGVLQYRHLIRREE